jgi:hypothetical protein
VEKEVEKILRKKYAKSDKTHPDPDLVSLSACSAFTIYANSNIGKN